MALFIACTLCCQDLAIVYYNQGIDAIERGDTAEAVGYFEKSIAERKTDPDAHFNLGVALIGVGELERARKEFLVAAETYPDDPALHLNLAEIYKAQGEFQSSRTEYEYALRRAPDLAPALSGYGQLLLEAERYEDAELLLVTALSVESSDPMTQFHMGWLYVRTGRYNEATHYFRRGMRQEPNSIYGHMGMGTALLMREDYTESLAEFQKVIALRPTDTTALVGAAQCNIALGRHAQAQRSLGRVLETDPSNAPAHKFRGDIYVFKEKYPWAVGHYRQAVQIRVDYVEAWAALGRALEAAGIDEEAEAAFQSGLQHDPYNAEILYRLGQLFFERDDVTGAELFLKEALAAANDVRLEQRIRATLKAVQARKGDER